MIDARCPPRRTRKRRSAEENRNRFHIFRERDKRLNVGISNVSSNKGDNDLSQYTVLSLREAKQIKRDAKREKRLLGVNHYPILDERARQLGYPHWADLKNVVNTFERGCVLAYLRQSLDVDGQRVLQAIGSKESDYLYPFVSADLLAHKNQNTAELRAQGLIKREDEEQDERSRFRRANPLYGVQLLALHPSFCVGHSVETIHASIRQVFSELNEEDSALMGYCSADFLDYIWLHGTRTDYGIGFSPNLPPELAYTKQELDDMEYATALEATAGW